MNRYYMTGVRLDGSVIDAATKHVQDWDGLTPEQAKEEFNKTREFAAKFCELLNGITGGNVRVDQMRLLQEIAAL
jgi:hypothetical protein